MKNGIFAIASRHAFGFALATLAVLGTAPAGAQKPTSITQLGFGAGSSTLIAAQAIRQLINEHSTGIRVEVQPGAGVQNKMYWTRRAERRRELIIDMTTHDALYPKPAEGLHAVLALFPNAGWGLLTTNPAIKTLRDLENKVVDAGGIELNGGGLMLVDMLRRVGISTDKVDLSKQTRELTSRADQLADDIADVAHSGIIDKQQLSPSMVELIRKRRLYLVDQTQEAIAPLAPATYPYAVCPGAIQRQYKLDYDPNQGRKVYAMYVVPASWASVDVPENVVYEYVSTIIKQRVKLINYLPNYGKTLAEQMGHIPVPQQSFHPGAQRAFKEFRITYGLEGIREWESTRTAAC